MPQGLAESSASIWRCMQCVGLYILFQTSAAITLKVLAVVWAIRGLYGLSVIISEGVSTFIMPREVEQHFFLRMDSLSLCPCLQYNWHLQNRCIDGCRVFLSFCFGFLTVSLLSWDKAWLCLLTHLWTSAAAPCLFNITASPVRLPLCSWWHLSSFRLWSPDIPGLAQTTQLAVFLASLLTTKCCLFTTQFLFIKLIKQPSFYKAADLLVFPPYGMLKVHKAARIPLPFLRQSHE